MYTYLVFIAIFFEFSTECKHGWVYDKTWYNLTISSQENWVCDKELYVTNTFVFCRIGDFLGTLIFGQLGDIIGRRPIIFMTLSVLILGRAIAVFSTKNYPGFLFGAVLASSALTQVFYQAPLVVGMEISRDKDRAYIAFLQCLGWTLGFCALPLLQWGFDHWAYFIFMTTLPCGIFIAFRRLVIESPRWLASRGKTARCIRELERIATVNKTKVPEETTLIIRRMSKQDKIYGVISLFSKPTLAQNTLILVFCWITTTLVYYTITLDTESLGGNPYLNFFLQAVVELPAYIAGKYLCDLIGRCRTHMAAFICASFSSLGIIFVLTDSSWAWLIAPMNFLVKFFICVSMYAVNLHALEAFPTCLRQTGVSLMGMSSSAFCTLGPYIVLMGKYTDERYKFVILSVLTATACLIGTFLPETAHRLLPETIQEANDFGKS